MASLFSHRSMVEGGRPHPEPHLPRSRLRVGTSPHRYCRVVGQVPSPHLVDGTDRSPRSDWEVHQLRRPRRRHRARSAADRRGGADVGPVQPHVQGAVVSGVHLDLAHRPRAQVGVRDVGAGERAAAALAALAEREAPVGDVQAPVARVGTRAEVEAAHVRRVHHRHGAPGPPADASAGVRHEVRQEHLAGPPVQLDDAHVDRVAHPRPAEVSASRARRVRCGTPPPSPISPSPVSPGSSNRRWSTSRAAASSPTTGAPSARGPGSPQRAPGLIVTPARPPTRPPRAAAHRRPAGPPRGSRGAGPPPRSGGAGRRAGARCARSRRR